MVRTYAVGAENRVVRSDNHNGIWNILYPLGPIKNLFYDVMTDPNTSDKVFIVGRSGDINTHYGIQYSTDAGLTWNLPGGNWNEDGPDRWFYEVWVVDANVIWVVGNDGIVVKSTDGGLNFNKVVGVPGVSLPGDIPYTAAIHAISANNAVVLGSPSDNVGEYECYVWKTIDGGNTWNLLNGGNTLVNSNTTGNLPNPAGKANGIWMSNDGQRIVVGTGYTQQLSTNGGASFLDINPEMLRSGEHLTWFPTYNASSIFRHTGGFTIQINESLDVGSTYITTKSLGLGDPSKIILGAHFYTANDGYFTNQNLIYSSPDGGVTESLTYTDANINAIFRAIWTGPPYINESYFELVSCCDPDKIIYAQITGGTIIEGGTYIYVPGGTQQEDALCYTITSLPQAPNEPIVNINLATELQYVNDCENETCVILCSPCQCTRAKIVILKGVPPTEDIVVQYVDCNNQIVNYTLPFDLTFGEQICAKYFIPVDLGGYLVQYETSGNCIFDSQLNEYHCPNGEVTYRLEDCRGIAEDIYTNVDLSEVVGQVITLRDENNKPLEGCWQVFEVTYQPIEVEVVLGVYKCYEDCEDCLPPAPEPFPLKPRTVDPNYTTGNCDPDIVEGAFCRHAEMMYKKSLTKRFAIKDCCPEDEDKVNATKEKIELLLIKSTNPTPDPCSDDPIINEYYFGRNDGDPEVILTFTNEEGVLVSFTIPACVTDCEPVRFCAVRGTITLNSVITFAVNESCSDPLNCNQNDNLVFVRPCIF